jgi:hypothetical protein
MQKSHVHHVLAFYPGCILILRVPVLGQCAEDAKCLAILCTERRHACIPRCVVERRRVGLSSTRQWARMHGQGSESPLRGDLGESLDLEKAIKVCNTLLSTEAYSRFLFSIFELYEFTEETKHHGQSIFQASARHAGKSMVRCSQPGHWTITDRCTRPAVLIGLFMAFGGVLFG